jgi:membrane protein implicated in regulation of membrane protease activity
VTLVAFIVISLLLPSPWNVVALACGVVLEVGEIVWGRRLARRMRPRTGAEALVGREARVVEACRPDGHVRLHGELWRATCAGGADVGDAVRVTAVRDLTLEVVPVEPAPGDDPTRDGERPGSSVPSG